MCVVPPRTRRATQAIECCSRARKRLVGKLRRLADRQVSLSLANTQKAFQIIVARVTLSFAIGYQSAFTLPAS